MIAHLETQHGSGDDESKLEYAHFYPTEFSNLANVAVRISKS